MTKERRVFYKCKKCNKIYKIETGWRHGFHFDLEHHLTLKYRIREALYWLRKPHVIIEDFCSKCDNTEWTVINDR